ncbi:MAG TPA: isochorismatase family protein [Armatimonadota bacterium]|jgi:nicotinamidase-related amidase
MAHPRLARRDDSVLLVVDLQDTLLKTVQQPDRVLANSALLLRTAKVLGIPVLATEQNPERLGPTTPAIRELLGGMAPVGKMAFSCCAASDLKGALRATQRLTVVLCGVEAHVCVNQTAHGLLEAGYRVHIPRDAVGSSTEENCWVGLDKAREAGGVVTSAETVVFEWLGMAGTAEFRQVLAYVKDASAGRIGGQPMGPACP